MPSTDITFCTIYTDDDRMPVYGLYDDKFQKQVQETVKLLNDAKGLIVSSIPRAIPIITFFNAHPCNIFADGLSI